MQTEHSTDHTLAHASAQALDMADPLASMRDLFHIPLVNGRHAVYLTGNSLGAQPKAAAALVRQELDDWATLGVHGHLHGRSPWYSYHEQFRGPMSRLVGAMPSEVVMMNTLTTNLHLLMVSFYRPTRDRFRIIIEDSAFPSDSYAVQSQVEFHASHIGFDPSHGLIRLRPRDGEETLRTDDIEHAIAEHGASTALVMLGGVNYLTGQWFEMQRITEAAHGAGCVMGWDLAHAAGNVPVQLHDWNVDFAAWCSYKYLNGGPGAVAGAFVHERHCTTLASTPRSQRLPIFAGWWGNDPATRFQMKPDFIPVPSADAWALSNPPILSLTPLKASLDAFDRAGIDRLREKSLKLTAFMEAKLRTRLGDRIRVITPSDPTQRGCQLSLHAPGAGRALEQDLHARGVIVDYREPDVIRAAPTPLYNSFSDVNAFVEALAACLKN
jgi:kynureninase